MISPFRGEIKTLKKSAGFKLNRSVSVVLVLVAAAGVYIRTIGFGFVYDDNFQVVENVWIRDFANLPQIFSKHVWGFLTVKPTANIYRPMMHVIYMIEYHIFGLSAGGFHLVNVLFHSLNSILVLLISYRLVLKSGLSDIDPKAKFIALGAGLIFALHPINSESVSWVSALPELSFTFFLLASLYFYLTSEGTGLKYFFSLGFFLLALLSKETAMALILIIPVYELLIRGDKGGFRWKTYLPYLIVAILYMIVRTYVLGGLTAQKNIDLSLYESAINVFPLVTSYFLKLIFPLNLNVLYEFHPIRSITELSVILSLLGIAVLVIALYLLRRTRLIVFLIIWILIPILPVLYVPALSATAFAERYLYLPSAGYALLLSYFLVNLFYLKGSVIYRYIAIVAALSILVVFTVSTLDRSSVWRDDLTLWTDSVKKSPLSTNVHYNLAWAIQRSGDTSGALEHYHAAIKLDDKPYYPDAHYNLAKIYYSKGHLDEALGHFRAVVEIDAGYMDADRWVKFLERRIPVK